jgi:F-type H+-transporting ATPase subunit b
MGSFDAGLFFWSLMTFGLLLLALSRYALKPLSHLLSEREKTIRESMEAASKARDEARQIREENQEALKRVREEAGRTIDEGQRIVADMKRQAAERAKEETEMLIQHARTEIDRELQRSLDELKGTVSNLSVRISRQVIRENLDEDRHRKLAEDFVEQLKKSHATRKR